MKFRNLAILASATLLSTHVAFAETPSIAELSLEQLMNIEVTTASKHSEGRSDTPASVTVVTAEEIRRFGYRTLAEALSSVPGFYPSNDRNYEYLGVRGFGRPGDYNTRILILLNGHRLNDANYNYAGVGNDLGVDMESVDHIEIIKGPGSSLWGTSALLSVVNIITKSGSSVDGSTITGEVGNEKRSRALAEYGTKTPDGVDFYSSISALHTEGEKNIFFPEFNNPSTNGGIAHNDDGETLYRALITSSYEGLSLNLNTNYRKKDIPTGSFGTIFNDDENSTVDHSTRVELRYDTLLEKESNRNLTFRFYFDHNHYHGNYVYDFGDGLRTANYDSTSGKTQGLEARYSQELTKNINLIVGSEVQNSFDLKIYNADVAPAEGIYINEKSAFTESSAFAQLEADLSSWATAIAGFRFDRFSSGIQETHPRGALLFHPAEDTTLKLLYGSAFRAPNNYEMNYVSASQSFVKNPDLKSETLDSYESVIEQKITKKHFVSLGAYYFKLDKLIDQTRLDSGSIQFQNMSGATSKGIEFQYMGQIGDLTKIFVSGDLVETHNDETNARLTNSPRQTAFAGIYLPVWKDNAYLAPQFHFIGSRNSELNTDIPSSNIFNLVLTTETLFKDINLSLGLYNIFDKLTYSSGAAEHIQGGIPQDGRTVAFKVGVRF